MTQTRIITSITKDSSVELITIVARVVIKHINVGNLKENDHNGLDSLKSKKKNEVAYVSS